MQGKMEYYALLTFDELDELVSRYIKSDMMDKKFEWCTEVFFKSIIEQIQKIAQIFFVWHSFTYRANIRI